MLISVIIPVYNSEKHLKKCLESVKSCSSIELECIMVNDGSTDESEKICMCFSQEDPRFKLINKKNTGVSDTRNRGIDEAQGEYLFFLDADDYVEVDAWDEILALAAKKKYDIVAFGYFSLFSNGDITAERFPEGQDIRLALLSTPMLNPCWGNLLRREVIIKNDIRFDKSLKTCEDAIFMIDFVQNSEQRYLSNICVLYYRIHGDSTMQKTSLENKLADFEKLFDRREAFLCADYDETIALAMDRQFFSVITDLLRFCAKRDIISDTSRAYRKNLENATLTKIIDRTQIKRLSPFYKKFEYMLIKRKSYTCLAVYYKLKSKM